MKITDMYASDQYLQDEEDGPTLGIIQKPEIAGNVLGHLFQIEFKAAKQAWKGAVCI